MYKTLSELRNSVTVEPVVLFYYTTHLIIEFLNTNLYLQKACRNQNTAPDLKTPCDDEKRGITFITNLSYHASYALMATLCIIGGIWSNWSDKIGARRKIFIIGPIFGQIFRIISASLQSHFWYWSVHLTIGIDIIIQICSGGFLLCLSMCKVSAADTSTIENRTTKIGLLTVIQNVCLLMGNGLAGMILLEFGFFKSYMICLSVTILALIFACIFVQDVPIPVEKRPSILQIFNLKDFVKDTKYVLFKNKGIKRRIVWLLMLTQFTVWFSFSGQKTVFYQYFRYRFKWNEKQYSYYVMYRLIGISIGTFFCTFVLSKRFHIHDGLIGTFASFWDTIASVCYTFANQTWQLYMIPFLDIFHGAAIAVHFSYISKFFEKNESGQLMSGLLVLFLFIPLCHPAFGFVFQQTMDVFPSAFFLLSGLFDFITFLLYGWTYYLCKKIQF